MKKIVKPLWISLGCICLALGCIGVVLPILPTVPFLLVTAFSFAKSSERLHTWFIGTKLYKKHLESFMENRAMTVKTKLSILTMSSTMMAIGFALMGNVPIGRICIAIVWVLHILYFIFRIKTIPAESNNTEEGEHV